MAEFIPFRGTRFNVPNEILYSYLCPPYDVISKEKRAELLAGNPYNIVSVELPEGGDDRYMASGSMLQKLLSEYLLVTDDEEQFYIYEMEFLSNGRCSKLAGVIGRMKLEPFENGVILPHENTLSAAKDDRFNLMKETFANISPIYSLFDDTDHTVDGIIERITERPCISYAEYEGVTHRIYSVSGQDSAAVKAAFKDKQIYIADGHHRYETALRFKEYCSETGKDLQAASYTLMACIPLQHPGLVVLPTHRAINLRSDFDTESFLKDCSTLFEQKQLSYEEAVKEMDGNFKKGITSFIYYDGRYILLTLKDDVNLQEYIPGADGAYIKLDVSVLHNLILTPLLSISENDLLRGSALIYTRDFNEAVGRVDNGSSCCAFCLNPTPVDSIAAVASAGGRMPQKSTYFWPKLLTGLVINIM